MKNITFILLLMFPAFFTNAQTHEVEKTVTGLFDALADLNVEKMKECLTSDAVIIEDGILWNADSLALKINNKKQLKDFNRINSFDFFDTKIAGDIAWTYYYNYASVNAGGKSVKIKWIESAMLVKENSVWKIKLLHSTLLERN